MSRKGKGENCGKEVIAVSDRLANLAVPLMRTIKVLPLCDVKGSHRRKTVK